jgi:16S rRNA (uracil1498-N3)-methyltransferase
VPVSGQEEKPRGFRGFGPAASRSWAMSERFFITTPPVAGRAVLLGDEARHLAKVLRAKPGDRVTLFDGSGRSWEARVATIGRGEVALEVGEPRESPPVRPPAITLAVALPKGERQKWLVEKLTELGVARLVPLVTERGVAAATAGAIERLERGVIEACKQCGRDRLMDIAAPLTVAEIVAATPAGSVGIVADPAGGPLDGIGWRQAEQVIGLVGPEGGFTAEELASATAAGWPQVALGAHVLRIETAAVALAARLQHHP